MRCFKPGSNAGARHDGVKMRHQKENDNGGRQGRKRGGGGKGEEAILKALGRRAKMSFTVG